VAARTSTRGRSRSSSTRTPRRGTSGSSAWRTSSTSRRSRPVVPEHSGDATLDELRGYCRRQISHYKIARSWKFVDAFPMTATGKVQKFHMRETAIEELGLQAAASVETA
jgi:acyl-CoA synthetase (AMP-forming)/AMP-acid ligase II